MEQQQESQSKFPDLKLAGACHLCPHPFLVCPLIPLSIWERDFEMSRPPLGYFWEKGLEVAYKSDMLPSWQKCIPAQKQ